MSVRATSRKPKCQAFPVRSRRRAAVSKVDNLSILSIDHGNEKGWKVGSDHRTRSRRMEGIRWLGNGYEECEGVFCYRAIQGQPEEESKGGRQG